MDEQAKRDVLAKVQKGLKAYDMEMLHRFVDKAENNGWVFGLPPGISPAQWPLDPISGYPLIQTGRQIVVTTNRYSYVFTPGGGLPVPRPR